MPDGGGICINSEGNVGIKTDKQKTALTVNGDHSVKRVSADASEEELKKAFIIGVPKEVLAVVIPVDEPDENSDESLVKIVFVKKESSIVTPVDITLSTGGSIDGEQKFSLEGPYSCVGIYIFGKDGFIFSDAKADFEDETKGGVSYGAHRAK
jgi:hypothetical protein